MSIESEEIGRMSREVITVRADVVEPWEPVAFRLVYGTCERAPRKRANWKRRTKRFNHHKR